MPAIALPDCLYTDRLICRRWRPGDLAPFAELNACPITMEYFPNTFSYEQTAKIIERIESGFSTEGFGLWALETRDTGRFIGFTGLSRPSFEAEFMPCAEIGWRLRRDSWGQGYAREAAAAAIDDGFTRVNLAEIVSFTACTNTRSIRVMQKLGMTNQKSENFLHPALADGHALKPHVLYRLKRSDWTSGSS